MDSQKIYLLAELTVLPEFLDDVKDALKQALIPTLQEAGCDTIGSVVDGLEANVFVQRRDLNRGWSPAGKRFREMEKYCVSNRGTFCFSRPFYTDQTAKPAFVES
jgi:hypothetical protein